mmetsp:Transcript_124967/g.296512  ORF Transcript_124967/g.296512 Transcript_124967/m.296512 type:complete len:376 (-) Transcript_124967:88-1215(-)|eukprot:CAMPEP_0181455988 /NCGR_PEP_ID=MMETSP1110-20121109/31039_1 /TAXON_ID=174948 /ORGANISM="Symbiodinium sp., Strain CCMP421" /LENGTH=375 /DNA_ID=CAMNT_0023580385 /DNA_START=220 /DNA_END=1347 /DNA_ORIENTATION=-
MAARAAIHLCGSYNVGDLLGEGFSGFVYACSKHGDDSQTFAAKVCAERPGAAEEMRSEVSLLQSLCHSSIVKIHDIFDDGKSVYFVMDRLHHDLLDGLHSYGMRESVDMNNLVHVVRQMATAVRYLHSVAVVHRDVKPDNFLTDRERLTDPNCKLVLADFGSACKLSVNARLEEQVGTKIYWAPEVYDGNYGFGVDVWALGICLHCVASNTFPFADEQEVRTKNIYLRYVNRQCRNLVSAMLQKVEEKRISMEEVLWHSWMTGEDDSEPDEIMDSSLARRWLRDAEMRLPSFARFDRNRKRKAWPRLALPLIAGLFVARIALRLCPGWDAPVRWSPVIDRTTCMQKQHVRGNDRWVFRRLRGTPTCKAAVRPREQ